MHLLLRAVFVLAFCVATIGAAGFTKTPERLAWPLYGGGLAVTLATGFLLRRRARAAAREAAAGDLSLAGLQDSVRRIRDDLRRLEAEQGGLAQDVLVARMDAILMACRAVGTRNEDYLRALGTQVYVSVWDGFSTAERLIARAWSMSVDGFPHEGVLEIPKARAHLDRALRGAHG